MTVQDVFKKFKSDMPSAEILMIINVNNKIVVSAPSDDTNEFDTLWVIENNEIVPYSPLKEMIAFQDACEHPLFKKEENSIQHYGIKGMHWGIRRFDYVPVGRNSSQQQTEAPKRRNYEQNSSTSTSKTSNSGNIIDRIKKAAADFANDPKNQNFMTALKDYSAASKGHGPGPVDFNNMYVSRSSKDLDVSDVLEMPKGSVVLSEKLAHINPGFWTSNDYTRHNNCPNCSFAVEMNKRGYTDFQANANHALRYEDIIDMYKGEKSYEFSTGFMWAGTQTDPPTFNDVKRWFSNEGQQQIFVERVTKYAGPPGSHGFISGYYKPPGFAGGHIFNYTVLKDGKIQIEDGQSGMIMTLEAAAKFYDLGRVEVTDMTNAKMDYEKLDAYNTYNESDKDYTRMREARQKFGQELVKKITNTVSTKMKDSNFLKKGANLVTSLLKTFTSKW